MTKPRIGFIGQGWIGRTYADEFESRGYETVRYALEAPYNENKAAVSECDIVIIAVPTPTTVNGFDASVVEKVLPLVGKGKTAVIKSTLLPGTTEALAKKFPDRLIMHSPEFLSEATRVYDAAHPNRNIVGIPEESAEYRTAAEAVLAVLPAAPFSKILPAREAELVKYAGNVFLAFKVVYANMLYDLASAMNLNYKEIQEALGADPRIGQSHISVMSASGHTAKAGRGAGGHCFIKDMEAFRRLYRDLAKDPEGLAIFDAVVRKNNTLLVHSAKDLDLLAGVYGDDFHDVLP